MFHLIPVTGTKQELEVEAQPLKIVFLCHYFKLNAIKQSVLCSYLITTINHT